MFLAGDRAWKLKRAVRYDYLDYSTAYRRRQMCDAEVRLSRRTTPALYRGVTAVTRQPDGSLAIGGDGKPVDWLVEMVRFDQRRLFIQLAEAGLLPLGTMPPLALAIARFHRTAEDRTNHGGWDGMSRIVDGNAAGFAHDAAGILDPIASARLTNRTRFAVDRVGVLLDQRRDAGFVRQCHGDLHLRNIVMLDDQPTLFDAIEFNDDISSIDVLYDLAFLLMDLWRLGLRHHANVVWNTYLGETAEVGGAALMPLFLSCRAAVVAKTTATSANLATDAGRRQELRTAANEYLAMAESLLDPPPPRLIAIGGLSGSGKSTLALDLAPFIGAAPGAIVIRSDEIRKHLCGVTPLERLGAEAYTDDMNRRVYATLMKRADSAVRGGYSVVADAVFAGAADRDAMQGVATAAGVPFTGLWLDAPESVLVARVAGRGPDASDAGADVVRQQVMQGVDPPGWNRIDASVNRRQVSDAAVAVVGDFRSAVTGV